MSPEAALAAALGRAFGHEPPARIGVAVSGGGDSMALMDLVADWAAPRATAVVAATVNHGLRAEAAAEANLAAQAAARRGVPHRILKPGAPVGRGNLQAAARAVRFELLAAWAEDMGLSHVCLGHTRDDQAETVLMRLARGSGVDGLSAMAEATRNAGLVWLRPLLGVRRAALREMLVAGGLSWAEDPTNSDRRFDRIKARGMLADPPLPGLDTDTLAETAARMAAARQVLNASARDAAQALARADHGGIAFAAEAFGALPDETRWRLLAAALCRVSGQAYRPRLSRLRAAEEAARDGHAHTIHGCIVAPDGMDLRIDREPAAATRVEGVGPGPWDGRWQIVGPACPDAETGPLGADDLARLGGVGETGIPRRALAASPAIRRCGRVIGAPLLRGKGLARDDWSAMPLWGTMSFVSDFGPD